MLHELKAWPEPFQAVWDGLKTFEFRLNDRGFGVGHGVLLREWDPVTKEYSGRSVFAVIIYIIGGGQFGIPEGYCIMQLGTMRKIKE